MFTYSCVYIVYRHIYVCMCVIDYIYVYTDSDGIHHVLHMGGMLWGYGCAPYAYSLIQYEIVWSLSVQTTGWGLRWSASSNRLPDNCSNDWHSSDCNVIHRPYNQNKHGRPIPTYAMRDSGNLTPTPCIMHTCRYICIYIHISVYIYIRNTYSYSYIYIIYITYI